MNREEIIEKRIEFYELFGYAVPGYYFNDQDEDMVKLLEESVEQKKDILSPWLAEKCKHRY